MKVLFYPGMTRDFRNTLRGHLYEIAKKYPVILLVENDFYSDQELVDNVRPRSEAFPKLEKIVAVNGEPGKRYSFFREFGRYRRLSKLSRSLIKEYKPEIVIVSSDIHSIFDRFLCRHARKSGAMVVVFQGTNIADSKTVSKWVDMIHAYEMFGGEKENKYWEQEADAKEIIGIMENRDYPQELVDFMEK